MGNIFEEIVDAVTDTFSALTDFVTDGLLDLLGIDDLVDDIRDEIDGTLVSKRGAVQHLPVVYGHRFLGGTLIHMEVVSSVAGSAYIKNGYLCLVYAIADGDSAHMSPPKVYIDDIISTDPKYVNYVSIEVSTGDHTTQPFPSLEAASSVWTADHLLLGTVCAAVYLAWNPDLFSGIPNVKFECFGSRVRSLVNLPTEVYVASSNPFDILFDYLTHPLYGKGLSTVDGEDINIDSFKKAASVANELVQSYSGGPSHFRMRCDIVLYGNATVMDNIKSILQTGRASLPYLNGNFYTFIEKDYTPAELNRLDYFEFNESNIIGSWSFKQGDVNSRYNRIKLTFPNEQKNFESDVVAVQSTTFRAEDKRLLEKSSTVKGITNIYRAIDMASILMRKSRQQLTAAFLATPETLTVRVGEIVYITHSTPGWDKKLFRITRMKLLRTGDVVVSVSEHNPTVYDLSIPNEYPVVPDTNLPNPNVVAAPTALTLVSDESALQLNSDGSLLVRIQASWVAADDAFVNGYEVEYKKSSDTTWIPAARTNSINSVSIYIPNVLEGIDYDVRVRSVNSNFKNSDWVTVLNHTVIGKTSNPSDVVGFDFSIDENGVTLFWDKSVDLDVAAYEIRKGGTSWGVGDSLVAIVDATNYLVGPLVSGLHVYRIKAVDTGGRRSTSAVTTTSLLTISSAVAPVVTTEFFGQNVIISWTSVSGSLPTVAYRVYIEHPQNGLQVIGDFTANELTYKVTWYGNAVFYVSAIDLSGNEGAQGSSVAQIIAPTVDTISNPVFLSDSVQLSWISSAGTFPVSHYEISIQVSGQATETVLANIKSDTFTFRAYWLGDATIRVKAIDLVGNVSSALSKIITVSGPSTPVVSASISGQDLVLSWSDSVATLGIDKYIIRYHDGVTTNFDTATPLAEIKTNTYSFQLVATIQRTYLVKAVDTFGNTSVAGSITFDPAAPNPIVFNQFSISGSSITLSWSDATSDLPIVEYIIKEGAAWATATLLSRTKSTSFTINGGWSGSKTFFVAPIDSAMAELNKISGSIDNYGSYASQVVSINPPAALSTVNVAFSEGSAVLTWSEPSSDLPVVSYKITRGPLRVHVATIDSTSFSTIPDWFGVKDFYVSAINSAGSIGSERQVLVDVILPNAPTINPFVIQSDRVEFTWVYDSTNQYLGSLPIQSYDIRYDNGSGLFATATKLLETGTDGFSRKVDWSGNRRFWVTPIDSSGNLGSSATISVLISPPKQISITPQVIDNNVLLFWGDATDSLPIDYYEIRKGPIYSTSELIGNISSRFVTVFETTSGDYTYWVTGVDTAGNLGFNNQVTVKVSEPPDYVLFDNQSDIGFAGTKTNAFVNSAGNLNLPVNTTETVAQHFDNNSWSSPDDQISAGYPIYIQPTPISASYVRQWDLGTILNNLSITINITSQVISGDLVFSTTAPSKWTATISTSTDGINWTNYLANNLKVFSSAFRYVKITIDVTTDSGDDLLEISDISYVIDVKEKSDSGSAEVTNATSGAVVSFNKSFVDISAINVTPYFDTVNGDTINNIKAIYDFEDVPNPTSFIVYLLDASGNFVTGKFTWTARGR